MGDCLSSRNFFWGPGACNTTTSIAFSSFRKHSSSEYQVHIKINLANVHPIPNFYTLLSIPKGATPTEIKSAYHRVLLQSHPDKRTIARSVTHGHDAEGDVDMALIKEAYTTLSNPDLRASYDVRLASRPNGIGRDRCNLTGPRPAQIISLEDFERDTDFAPREGDDEGPWRYPCRCAGWYRISNALMEQGNHLIPCSSCSEVIWVGYEEVDVEG